MTVDIWSDVACPFCYIGKRHFEQAVSQAGLKDQINVEWRSFQLDPNAPEKDDRTIYQILAAKYDQTEERAKDMSMNVVMMGANAGLDFNMDQLQPANTFDAHRLIHFAKSEGKQDEMKEVLLRAYFVEGKHVGDSETLIALAEDAGLDKGKAFIVLDSDQYADDVQEDIQAAQTIGIQGVPFFLINKKYGISGAQPVASFIKVFEQILEKEKATSV